ncbi:UNVERIFIED_CONTAM: hypothetical protein FKN15_071295 [Acipenser sinensis]
MAAADPREATAAADPWNSRFSLPLWAAAVEGIEESTSPSCSVTGGSQSDAEQQATPGKAGPSVTPGDAEQQATPSNAEQQATPGHAEQQASLGGEAGVAAGSSKCLFQ